LRCGCPASPPTEDDDIGDDLDDVIFGDYDDDAEAAGSSGPDDADWLDQDPELMRLLQANDANFARLLRDMDEGGSDSGDAVGGSSPEQQQAESWAGMGVEDWLEAAAAAQQDTGSSSSDGRNGGLADVMDAIDADSILDEAGRLEAKVRIAGVFNQDQGAAAAASAAAASRRRAGSSGSSAAAGAAASGPEGSSTPTLLPRPLRPTAPQ